MKVAVLCPLSPDSLRQLRSRHDCAASVHPDEAAKFRLVEDAEVVVLRSPIILDRATIEKASRLQLVVRAGVGWDNVDRFAARERKIQLVSIPVPAHSVAELIFGLTLALCRNISRLHRSLQEGRWEKHLGFGRALSGRTLGLLGFGRIGMCAAEIAKGFRMTLLACDRSPWKPQKQTAARALGVQFVEFPDLFALADVLTIQLPLGDDTDCLVGTELIGRMKQDAMLVNVGRGRIVDEQALYRALRDGKIGGAATDVFAAEPPGRHPLLELDNFVATPHVGAQTVEAQREIGETVVRIIDAFAAGEDLAQVGAVYCEELDH
jgi:phosphoglycerate dehydrogenase-like enzyme